MQFMRVLAQMRIQAPDHIMNVLLRRYMDKGNVDEVNYVDFCNEVDSAVDIFGVGLDYNQSFDYMPRNQARAQKADIVVNNPIDIDDVLARIRE